MKNYIFDSHVHSNNSFDAKDSVKDLCEWAIKNEIQGFCITDHLDINDCDETMERSIIKSHEETRKASEIYGEKLKLRVGIELGQPLQDLQLSERILRDFPCDFIIGSMHNVKGEKDFYFMSEPDFQHRLDELLTKYYEEYYEMVKWGKFDVIGHITYPLRYIEGNFNLKVDMTKYNEIIFEMLKTAVDKNVGIEINVSGFRQPYGKQFPDFNHIKEYKNLGGEIITIGSDSHNRFSLGHHFKEGRELLLEAGINHYCEFENRKPKMITIL